MDESWARGWRHFGTHFFRSSLQTGDQGWLAIVPLRIRLSEFKPGKSQRRVLRKNADVLCTFEPSQITGEFRGMFDIHKRRFTDNEPSDLADFLGGEPATRPCEGLMLRCELNARTVAVSFLDVGQKAMSSVYAFFDPEYSHRSLGIFTMLKEIEFAQTNGMELYYPGYATEGHSHYDYKKRFRPMEGYDWIRDVWSPLEAASNRAAQ